MVFSRPGFKEAGRIPYAVTLKALERYFRATIGPCELWPRHSYVTGAHIPFLSDLDVTLWLERRPEPSELPAFRRAFKHAFTLFPLLGEANIFVAPEESLLEFANSFELARDPILLERARPRGIAIAERAQASAFILRQLDADFANLAHNPASRERKWASHFKLLSARIPDLPEVPVTLDALFGLAAELAGFPGGGPGSFAAEAARLTAIPREDRTESKPVTDWWCALYPQWFCHKGFAYPPITGGALELFLAQLSWEICGVWSQSLHNEYAPTFANHLRRLGVVLKEAAGSSTHPAIPAITAGLDKLTKLV
jgi:hypothetical protein